MINILLADADPAVRAAFQILLKRRLPVASLQEASDWDQLAELVDEAKPDLLLLDLRLPGMRIGQELREWIKSVRPLLVVGMSIKADDRENVLACGVHTFLYKGENPNRVIQELEHLLLNNIKSLRP